jgi:hypothetical protein
LFGTVNEPMRLEWQTGYRNDNFHWHLQNPGDGGALLYSEHYRNLQYWENALQLSVIYRDIALFARGAYGALGSGQLKQRFANTSYTPLQPILFFHTQGWTLDGWGYFGYSVNLTDGRTYKVILVPFVGYGANYERLDRQGSEETSGTANPPATGFTLLSSLPKNLHTTWFGPLIGGFFRIVPGGRMRFEAGYSYHWEHVRMTSYRKTQVSRVSGSTLLSTNQETAKIKVKDGGSLAHSGWARLDWDLDQAWRAGLYAQIQYLVSRVLNANVKNEQTGAVLQQKYKARWTAVGGAATLSRTF